MAPRSASLFGKVPSALDYVRVRLDGDAAIAFDTWTQQAIQELARAQAEWPSMCVRFLFAPSDTRRALGRSGHPMPAGSYALVGVMVKSRDRAGRKFPVAIFGTQPVAALARTFPAVPLAWEGFFAAAEALLTELPTLTREQLSERLDAITVPDASELTACMRTVEAMLDTRTAQEFAHSTGGASGPLDAVASGELFVRATADLRRAAPGDRPAVLDCPASESADVVSWLALAERTLSWSQAVPSVFWHPAEREGGRVLLSPGAPPALLPAWLADPARRHGKLTPVRVDAMLASAEGKSSASLTLHALFDTLLRGP